MKHGLFLMLTWLLCHTSPAGARELHWLGVADLQRAFADGRLGSTELVDHLAARVDSLDGRLGALIEWNPQARDQARALDEERARGVVRGPLHGVPVLLKANIDTGDRMATSAGSLLLRDHRAAKDAPLVQGLRQAGAVILDKTNLSEWANFRSTASSSGWSSLGGQCRNPWVLDRSPCGSSSGSAAAVAAGFAPLAVGTETDGSIVCPASHCGIVGLKPTLGYVSRTGIIPISRSQDTAGPMGRSVIDVALLLQAMAVYDKGDSAMESRPRELPDLLKALERTSLEGLRIGLHLETLDPVSQPGLRRLVEGAGPLLEAAGASVTRVEGSLSPEGLDEAEFTVLLGEFRSGIEAYLESHDFPAGLRSLEDLVEANRREAASVMPWFGQELFEQALEAPAPDSPEGREALQTSRRLAWEALEQLLAEDLDLLILPSNSPSWKIDWLQGDRFDGGVFTSSLAAVAGWPSLTLPMGLVHGLPAGISLVARPWREDLLLQVGRVLEEKRGPFPHPEFRASLEQP